MKNFGDSIASNTIVGMIFGIPVLLGIVILSIPFLIISYVTDIPMSILLQNLAAFAISVFLVWFFSRYQIIENGLVGLIVGLLVYKNFQWHSLICILIGAAIVGLLFLITYIKTGFWIKTILFSVIVTFLVFAFIYSDAGVLPLPDMIWKISFVVIFFLENIFIRCAVSANNGVFLVKHSNARSEQDVPNNGEVKPQELVEQHSAMQEDVLEKTINDKIQEIGQNVNTVEEVLKKESTLDLLDMIGVLSLKRNMLDSKIEEKVYRELRMFINIDSGEYIIIPHVAFREVFEKKAYLDDKFYKTIIGMHFDFGIYDKRLNPILFIEIWGKDHFTDEEIMKRDKFKKEVLNKYKLKLAIIDASEMICEDKLREKIVQEIKKAIPSREDCQTYCPQCNALMEITFNKATHEHFYGCTKYNKILKAGCKKTLSLSEVPPLYIDIPIIN